MSGLLSNYGWLADSRVYHHDEYQDSAPCLQSASYEERSYMDQLSPQANEFAHTLEGAAMGHQLYPGGYVQQAGYAIPTPYDSFSGHYSAQPTFATPMHTASFQPNTYPVPAQNSWSISVQPLPSPSFHGVLCRWDPGCDIILDDVTPAGITRHLKEYHFGDAATPWHNKNRGLCQWLDWDGQCDREMNYASFGKHIAAVHLHSTAQKCPYCSHELGRADSLDRHIRNYCEHSPRED